MKFPRLNIGVFKIYLAASFSLTAISSGVTEVADAGEEGSGGGGLLSLLAKSVVGKSGGDNYFYAPFDKIPITPADRNIKYEDVIFKSADGVKLHAWFMPAEVGSDKAKATVVFSHGNSGNVAYHIGFVDWMMKNGYNVFLYDYRGFGKSEGVVDKAGIITDALAAFRYIGTRRDLDTSKIISFGHSLGGAKSLAAINKMTAKEKDKLKGIALMGAFSSYKKIAEKVMGTSLSQVVSDDNSPIDLVGKMPKVPLVVIHARNDSLIPFSHGEALFKVANEPKSFYISENGGHVLTLEANDGEMQNKLLTWMNELTK